MYVVLMDSVTGAMYIEENCVVELDASLNGEESEVLYQGDYQSCVRFIRQIGGGEY